MKKSMLYFKLFVIIANIGFAQLGGLLNKVKPSKADTKTDSKVEGKTENKGDKKKYNDEIISKFERYYNILAEAKLDDESTLKREKTSLALDIDSAKQMSEYFEKNKADGYYEKQYLIAYSNFNKNFENGALKSINDYLVKPYNAQSYGIEWSQLNWFKYAKSAINSARKVYTGATNLDEISKNIDTKKNEYAQSLVKSKWLMCPEQLDYFQQIRFSDNGNETGCVRGKDKFDLDVTENGVYIYYTGEITLRNYKIYVDGKETGLSLSDDYLKESNGGSTKTDAGWFKLLLLPGTKLSTSRTLILLDELVSKYTLKDKSEIMLTNTSSGKSYKFIYNLSKHKEDIKGYLKVVKSNYLKTVKLPDTKYTNAAVEKETLEAYKNFCTVNPQYYFGDAGKVIIEGNNWQIKKTSLGLIDHQQSNAYFIVKGNDGNCYMDWRQIRKVYDPKTKTYGPIKVVGGVDKKEISCDLIK